MVDKNGYLNPSVTGESSHTLKRQKRLTKAETS